MVTTEDAARPVVVDGVAEPVADRTSLRPFLALENGSTGPTTVWMRSTRP